MGSGAVSRRSRQVESFRVGRPVPPRNSRFPRAARAGSHHRARSARPLAPAVPPSGRGAAREISTGLPAWCAGGFTGAMLSPTPCADYSPAAHHSMMAGFDSGPICSQMSQRDFSHLSLRSQLREPGFSFGHEVART